MERIAVAGVITEMNKRSVEEMDKPGPHYPVNLAAGYLRRMQEPVGYGPDYGKTEREHLPIAPKCGKLLTSVERILKVR
jgi:hypothetical protein